MCFVDVFNTAHPRPCSTTNPLPPHTQQASFNISAAASEDKGRRNEMEDVWIISNDARGDTKTACRCMYAAVFDGHGGKRAAEFAAQHLHTNVLAADMLASVNEAGVASVGSSKKAILEVRGTHLALLCSVVRSYSHNLVHW